MRQEEINEFLKTGYDELFWVRFKGLVDEEYLVICDECLIAFCVHQEKLEYYYETGFVLEPEKIFEIRSSGIPVSKAKLTGFQRLRRSGFDNEEFQRLRY